MPSAKVTTSEIDLSTRIPSFPGLVAAIAVASKKGKVNQQNICTSESDYLNKLTINQRINVGDDLAHYSGVNFLGQGNRLLAVRAANSPLYGGLTLFARGTSGTNYSWATGTDNPLMYSFASDELLIIYGANEGEWNNDVSLIVYNYTDSPDYVKEPDCFKIDVYKALTDGYPTESWLCSRIPGKKDGFGRNVFIEDVLKQSNYIRGFSNPVEPTTVLPKEQITSKLPLGGGDDGGTVNASHLINAIDAVSNKEETLVTLLMDGGHNEDPAYQQYLAQIAEQRQDCVAILSVPYEVEGDADPLSAIKDWMDSDLMLGTSSYAAIYSSYLYAYDKYNARNLYLSPDGFVAANISRTASMYQNWFATAGWKRGALIVRGLHKIWDEPSRDFLDDIGVNPIRYKDGRGIAIWGNKTTLGRPSLLQYLNIRMLFITIEPAIAAALENFLFEQNDSITRLIIKTMIEEYMDVVRARRGVYDYDVVCDETNNPDTDIDNGICNVWLFVKPIGAIQWIKFTTVVTRYGFDFKLAEESLGVV